MTELSLTARFDSFEAWWKTTPKQLFIAYDKAGSDHALQKESEHALTIGRDEFRKVCRVLDLSLAAITMDEALVELDASGGGHIHYDTFAPWWRTTPKYLFGSFDPEGAGSISVDAFVQLCSGKPAALAQKTKKELKVEARKAGVSDGDLDDAGEAENEKQALIDLILAADAGSSAGVLVGPAEGSDVAELPAPVLLHPGGLDDLMVSKALLQCGAIDRDEFSERCAPQEEHVSRPGSKAGSKAGGSRPSSRGSDVAELPAPSMSEEAIEAALLEVDAAIKHMEEKRPTPDDGEDGSEDGSSEDDESRLESQEVIATHPCMDILCC